MVQYFVKVDLLLYKLTESGHEQYGAGELGKNLLESEHYAMTRLAGFLPDAVPEPLGCDSLGTTGTTEYGYFYLAKFMIFQRNALPPAKQTGALIARLHQASMGTTRFFGSSVLMYNGIFCHVNSLET